LIHAAPASALLDACQLHLLHGLKAGCSRASSQEDARIYLSAYPDSDSVDRVYGVTRTPGAHLQETTWVQVASTRRESQALAGITYRFVEPKVKEDKQWFNGAKAAARSAEPCGTCLA
jgi:hypothetical protein